MQIAKPEDRENAPVLFCEFADTAPVLHVGDLTILVVSSTDCTKSRPCTAHAAETIKTSQQSHGWCRFMLSRSSKCQFQFERNGIRVSKDPCWSHGCSLMGSMCSKEPVAKWAHGCHMPSFPNSAEMRRPRTNDGSSPFTWGPQALKRATGIPGRHPEAVPTSADSLELLLARV